MSSLKRAFRSGQREFGYEQKGMIPWVLRHMGFVESPANMTSLRPLSTMFGKVTTLAIRGMKTCVCDSTINITTLQT